MYISYAPLWKLLAERSLKKADLAETAGLSSRTIAKLTKNETVTTDTLAKICAALRCSLSDIAEYADAPSFDTIQESFAANRTLVGETENCKVYELDHSGRKYRFYVTNERAGKSTHIECREDGTVYWVQFRASGHIYGPLRVDKALVKPELDKNVTTVVLIMGRPAIITGLDDGIFHSAPAKPGLPGVYVMSEAAFKCSFEAE